MIHRFSDTLRFLLTFSLISICVSTNAQHSSQSVSDLLERIGGEGFSKRISTSLLPAGGAESFTISAKEGKPHIEANTLSALTRGIGWYLNHYAGVNIGWENLHPSIGQLPLPKHPETHVTDAEYRYYLNYCTFSYSMSTWTWERWQEEIDWMALRGINMPLQIVGLEDVWRRLLRCHYGYSDEDARAFVGGPCFMAWFGMNNLEGWGGPNPEWWFERQADLGLKINGRMKELGIMPVLPGFAGMVPHDFTERTGIPAMPQGKWCGFQRPYILDSTTDAFPEVAVKYYDVLKEVMGDSEYYSLDPYHEGGAAPENAGAGYKALYEAMNAANPSSKWVIQSWQWSKRQKECLDNVPIGKLIVLDLFADGRPAWDTYKGHDTVYSTIFNFGARTGFFGRFDAVFNGYEEARKCGSVKGIGASPEGIGQTPGMYDLLYELPWMESGTDAGKWLEGYVDVRYGNKNKKARKAWELLRKSALGCTSDLQGPHEATVCARPSLDVECVSTWGGTEIFYNPADLVEAVELLLSSGLQGQAYEYDMVDLMRQALTDKSRKILAEVRSAHERGDSAGFSKARDAYLGIMDDIDELLCTHPSFMFGSLVEMMHGVAEECGKGGDSEACAWLGNDNLKTLITTWGHEEASERGGLKDYSYRQMGGMMGDFYSARWRIWFDNGMEPPTGGWYEWEHSWAMDAIRKYKAAPVGNPVEMSKRLYGRHFSGKSKI